MRNGIEPKTATAGVHRLELAVHCRQQRINHSEQLAQRVCLRHSLFKVDVAEHRPWKSGLPLIFLVWVVLGWLQIVLADASVGGEFFNDLLDVASRMIA